MCGFCYGIAQAGALVRAGTAKHVLVIGVEKLSDFIDNTERTISFLLGDSAGAAVVGVSDEPARPRPYGVRTAPAGAPSA